MCMKSKAAHVGPRDAKLKELYLERGELVVNLPEWLLPWQKIRELWAMPGLAIVEIAGRDSVAAAVRAVEEQGFTDLLPTYVYTGTEYGPWSAVMEAVRRLSRRLPKVRTHSLLVFGSPRFWHALNGRFVGELISRFGFYTPCVGCHVYLHSIRIPLSLILGKPPIISGERELHDGSIKLNQISEALTVYQKIAGEFGIELLFPLRNIAEGNQIKDILGLDWEENREQLGCVLSGNYRRMNGSPVLTSQQVQRYLDEFASPASKRIIRSYVEGNVPDHVGIAATVLNS
jgi:hypothetical protein